MAAVVAVEDDVAHSFCLVRGECGIASLGTEGCADARPTETDLLFSWVPMYGSDLVGLAGAVPLGQMVGLLRWCRTVLSLMTRKKPA